MDTGTTRLEHAWSRDNRVLICWLDMGSVGWPAKHWVYLSPDTKVRGWWWPDPAHRRWDNWQNSCKAAGLGFLKNEILLIASLGSAPFGNCAHFGRYSEAAAEFFTSLDTRDPLFCSMYARLVADWYPDPSPYPCLHRTLAQTIQTKWDIMTRVKTAELCCFRCMVSHVVHHFQWTRTRDDQ